MAWLIVCAKAAITLLLTLNRFRPIWLLVGALRGVLVLAAAL